MSTIGSKVECLLSAASREMGCRVEWPKILAQPRMPSSSLSTFRRSTFGRNVRAPSIPVARTLIWSFGRLQDEVRGKHLGLSGERNREVSRTVTIDVGDEIGVSAVLVETQFACRAGE